VPKEEAFILRKMVEGDEDAFKYFFDTYYDDLCNFVNGYMRDEALSEDIVQSIFVFLWENKGSLPPDCSVKSYLYSASKNKSLNFLRNQKNKLRIVEKLGRSADYIEDASDQFMEFDELKRIIGNAVDQLPDRCKKIYQLRRDEGLTNKEIGKKLGITVKTVEKQITIAIKKLKEHLHPYLEHIFILFLFFHFF